MANKNTPLGFRPTGHIYGCHPYKVASTHTAIKEGSPIKPADSGYVELALTTEALILGVAANALATNTGGTVWVYDNPKQHFICQDNAALATDITYQNACMDCSTEASTSDVSDVELIAAEITGSGQFRILYPAKTLYPDGVENALGANCDWVCMVNEHVYKNETGI